MIKVFNLALAISLTVGASAALAETVVVKPVDPALTKALETIHGFYAGHKVATPRKASQKISAGTMETQRNLDKNMILGGAEAFPM